MKIKIGKFEINSPHEMSVESIKDKRLKNNNETEGGSSLYQLEHRGFAIIIIPSVKDQKAESLRTFVTDFYASHSQRQIPNYQIEKEIISGNFNGLETAETHYQYENWISISRWFKSDYEILNIEISGHGKMDDALSVIDGMEVSCKIVQP